MKNTTNILLQAVEQDNLELFMEYFVLENWRDTVTKIDNYAGISEYTKKVSKDNCDIFKYSLHCNADKIFNYLLPLVDTHKHGDKYGWPLLSMALKNNRYDYAHSIINHKLFNPYPRYHTNCFSFIEKKNNPEQHIDFLFHYLDKFDKYDLQDSNMIYTFTHLACYNEHTYSRFMEFYQHKTDNPNATLIDFFQDKVDLLGKEIYYHYFRTFILDKLDIEQLRTVFNSIMNDTIVFTTLFESEQAEQCLHYLLKTPDLLQQYLDNNLVMLHYLSLDCILILEEHNIDLWVENKDKDIAVDYILEHDNLEDPATLYFMNKYTQKIFDRYEQHGYQNNIYKYCHNKLLLEKLPVKHIKNKHSKI